MKSPSTLRDLCWFAMIMVLVGMSAWSKRHTADQCPQARALQGETFAPAPVFRFGGQKTIELFRLTPERTLRVAPGIDPAWARQLAFQLTCPARSQCL